jgi:formylglycine-generating enzyme required for sulfatase activity
MAGNVWEYIYDSRRTYTEEAQIDPLGDTSINQINVRGGSTAWNTEYNRVSFRYAATLTKNHKASRRAFRFVLDADRVMGEDNQTYQAYETICAGDTYTWNDNTYSKPGTYTDTLTNIYGCDSIVTLHLEVLPDPPITFTVNGVSFKMMRVRAGTFMMGATPEQDSPVSTGEKPAHQVTLTRDYFIGETMLTQELWTAVMGTTVQEEEIKSIGKHENLGYGESFPMYCISYYDCLNFVKNLSDSIGLVFRMPTEAEWEYAARGGHLSRGYKYPGSNNATEVAWNVDKDPNKKLHEVKQLLPNELGLYDMAGNAWEWVYDNHRTYTEEPQIDPMGDTLSTHIYIRGGSSYYPNNYNRVSNRGIAFAKTFKKQRISFRFVLDADRVISEDNQTYQAYDTICPDGTYVWHGNTYTKPGTYTDTLTNIYGCDSIVTLHLAIPKLLVTDNENANNTAALSPYNNTMAEVTLVRPLQLNHWNTIALPFSLDNEQIRQVFGEGTQVAILTDSYLKSENSVYVEFDYVNTIEAGKPYLIMPIQQASSPILTTINTSANTITTSIVDMIPVLDETQWQASEYNFFLGPDAYLYQNALDGTMPALRAYFQFHHLTPQQLAHIRAHVAFNENGTTKVEDVVNPLLQNEVQKIIEDNQLYIIRNGVKYTIHGLRAK